MHPPTGPGKSRVPRAGGQLPTGSSSRLKHLDYVGRLNFLPSVTVSHLCFGEIKETASEHAHVSWLTARETASYSLPLESLPLQGRKSSPGHPTKCTHQVLNCPLKSNPAQHSDWAFPHMSVPGKEPQIFLKFLSMYEAASSMKMGPGGTLRKGVKCQTG